MPISSAKSASAWRKTGSAVRCSTPTSRAGTSRPPTARCGDSIGTARPRRASRSSPGMASKAKAKAPPLDRATAAMLERAAALHRGGKLAEAETLYRGILATDEQQFDALHLLGVVRYQQGYNA